MNDGDWVEGKPQWWWKYVFPAEEQFWASILQNQVSKAGQVNGPSPEPWRKEVTAILEGLAMVNATATVGKGEIGEKLRAEGVAKIVAAANKLRG